MEYPIIPTKYWYFKLRRRRWYSGRMRFGKDRRTYLLFVQTLVGQAGITWRETPGFYRFKIKGVFRFIFCLINVVFKARDRCGFRG